MNYSEVDFIIDTLREEGFDVAFAAAGAPYIRRAYKKIGQAQGKDLVMGFSFDMDTSIVQDEIDLITSSFSKSATDSTLDGLKRVLHKAVEAGASIEEAAEMIREHAKTYAHRAEVIARNEITRACNKATLRAFIQSGVVVKKMWSCAPDCCPICEPHDGEVVDVHEAFFSEGTILEYQEKNAAGELVNKTFVCDYGDVDAGNLHVNCRCTILGVIG